MKVSLIALIAACAVAGSAFAVTNSASTSPPPARVLDSTHTNPPHLFDSTHTNPPHLFDSTHTNPPHAVVLDSTHTNPPHASF
jgi:hypothetical protein